MARQRNIQTIMLILDASWRLFGEKGYANTSYADISRESGINRATVQHYFPKKEFIASGNLVRLRSCAVEKMMSEYPDVTEPFARLFVLGQIYLAALMSSESSRCFMCGILENRLLTSGTIDSDFAWSLEFILGTTMQAANPSLAQDIVVAMGGLYELMYHCVLNESEIDIAMRLRPAFRRFSTLLNIDEASCEQILEGHSIEASRLMKLGASVYKAVSGSPVGVELSE